VATVVPTLVLALLKALKLAASGCTTVGAIIAATE
jgi:hypothetical protein